MNEKEKIGTLTQAIHQHSAPAADKYIKQVEELFLAQDNEIKRLENCIYQIHRASKGEGEHAGDWRLLLNLSFKSTRIAKTRKGR